MIEQIEIDNILGEIFGWVAFNMLAISFIGFSIYFTSDLTLSCLGGGVLIASCQWIFLRHLHPQIPVGVWGWVLFSDLASSMGAIVAVAILQLGLPDHPTATDVLLSTFLLVSIQMISLSVVQRLLLNAGKYKRVARWVFLNILGYGLAVIFLLISIQSGGGNFEAIVIFTLSMILATGISGWAIVRCLEAGKYSKVDNSVQEVSQRNKNVYYFQANLENQNFRGQNFDGADFRKANLRMAILEDISCEPVSVTTSGWVLWGLFFLSDGTPQVGNTKLKSTDFSGADLTGANLKQAKLREAIFRKAILRQANLTKATLVNAGLIEADLTNANLSYSDMRDAILYKTNLEGADLTGAILDGADLEGAYLKNAILHSVDLRKVKNLSSANLTGADLRQANLNKATLVNIELMEADLTSANLSYTDMRDAFLNKTNLEGADLTGAILDGADLEGANLKNAILHSVDLRKVENLSSANLTGADLSNAIMPEER